MRNEYGTVTTPDGAVLTAVRKTYPTGTVEVFYRQPGSALAYRLAPEELARTFTTPEDPS